MNFAERWQQMVDAMEAEEAATDEDVIVRGTE